MSKTVKEVICECMFKTHIRNITIITSDNIITGRLSAFIVSEEKTKFENLEVERYGMAYPGDDFNLFKYLFYDEFEKFEGHDIFIFIKENANC